MNALISLGLGIIIFALIVATGLVVMANFGTAVAECPAGYSYNTNGSVTYTTGYCYNNTSPGSTGTNITSPSKATGSINTMVGYMQDNLITWVPAVIALGIGLLFIGALMGRKQMKY